MTNAIARPNDTPAPAVALTADARRYAAASKAANTRRAYGSQLAQWEVYAAASVVPAYPAHPAHVANWLAQRASAGQAHATLRTAIAAVRAGHVAHGIAWDSRAPEIEAVMAGIGRAHAREQV